MGVFEQVQVPNEKVQKVHLPVYKVVRTSSVGVKLGSKIEY